MRLRESDNVEVVSGADRGKRGKILRILRDGRVLVEGVNLRTKHQKPGPKNPKGGIVKKENPLHASKVMPVDPASDRPTRVAHRVVDGKKVRVAVRSGKPLPAPAKE
jgi:large subunit ribosomal protein L24